MTMSTSDIICITNRKLCSESFLERLHKIARCHPAAIVLREKDLSPEEYRSLARQVMPVCQAHHIPCILHSFPEIAAGLHADAIHLPLPLLRSLSADDLKQFRSIGTSCHSIEDALVAEQFGCTYIFAGHIFETDCKKGLPGRGISFLKNICHTVSIPVYAIGGIGPSNISQIQHSGAAGICLMSSLMTCPDVSNLLETLEQSYKNDNSSIR